MEALLVVISLALIIGSVLGWVAIFQLKGLREDNKLIRTQMQQLKAQRDAYKPAQTAEPQFSPPVTDVQPSQEDLVNRKDNKTENTDTSSVEMDSIVEPVSVESVSPQFTTPTISTMDQFILHLSKHWMIWVGGASIGFAGIFLVKYSMDSGWLGPMARIVVGFITGILLHVAAYLLHIRKGPNQVFAALAGGASLVLYAVVLAALHLYQFFEPSWAFILLAVVSLLTMVLALVQGPVLAGLGILGAYLVPIFVNTGSNNMSAALIYSFIITCSALLLLRYVAKQWLWVGTLVGAGFWWLISLTATDVDTIRLLYLLAIAYTIVAISHWDWRLMVSQGSPCSDNLLGLLKGGIPKLIDKNYVVLVFILAAVVVSLVIASEAPMSLWPTVLISALMLWLAKQHLRYLPLAWLSFIAVAAGLLLLGMEWSSYSSVVAPFEKQWLLLLAAIALIYCVGGMWAMRSSAYSGYWGSLGYMAPLIILAVAHLLVNGLNTSWEWASAAVLLGMIYFNMLYRKRRSGVTPEVMAALIIAGHFAYTLAVVMLTREASLTLALAIQLVSLVWVDRHLPLPILPYLVKVILAAVILRLTFNPWLLTYPSDVHWSFWTYGGSLVCCLLAIRLLKNREALSQWLQGAALHLAALTVISETRYQLYDGNIFSAQYTFFEAAFYTSIAGVMGLVYRVREAAAGHLTKLYHWLGNGLLIIALANYGVFLLLIKNPLFNRGVTISETPLFNILLLAYGVPCLLVLAAFYLEKTIQWRRLTGALFALCTFIFISLEIRHLWHGQLHIDLSVLTGELYTYSMVWLAMAIAASLVSVRYRSSDLYKASMLFLIIVVLKIFLIDTSGLSSLWRVASFMGLGIALLGLAYFYQKMRSNIDAEPEEISPQNA